MKTKSSLSLPPARIRKIIQADRQIGKLASSTPVLVSKVTELFISELISRASKLAMERGDAKLALWHL